MLPASQIGQIIDLGQFKVGLNTKDDFDTLTLEESPDCMDVIFSRDAFLERRAGRTVLGAQVAAGAYGRGLIDFGVSPGVRKLIGKFGSTIYKMDDLDGTFDSLLTNSGDCDMHAAQSKTKLIICRDDWGNIYYWDGITASATRLHTKAPQARYPINWEGYLFLAYPKGKTNRFYYEDDTVVADEEDGDWSLYYDIRTSNGGDEFTGWAILRNRLYAFFKHSIHRLNYLGGNPLFEVNELITITGAVPRTIQNIMLPNGQEVIVFLNWQRRICAFDGTYIQYISERIESNNDESLFYMNNVNLGGLQNAHAVVDLDRQWYLLYLPVGGNANNTHCIVLDYNSMALFPFSNQTIHSSVLAEDSVGVRQLIGTDYDGYAYKMYLGNTDNGTTIPEHYSSSKLGSARMASLKRPRKIQMLSKPVANYAVTYSERLNFDLAWTTRGTLPQYNEKDAFLGTTFVLGNSVLGSTQTKRRNTLDLPAINNAYQYKIASGGVAKEGWRIHKVEFIETEVGVGAKYENQG